MGRLPKGWKKVVDKEDVIAYSKKNYVVYIWKQKKLKRFVVEPFRKLANYKRRLFSRQFQKISAAKEFAWNLMKQKEIRGYYIKNKK